MPLAYPFPHYRLVRPITIILNIGTQGVQELLFCELKAPGSSSIVIRLIQQVWLQYTAKNEFVSS